MSEQIPATEQSTTPKKDSMSFITKLIIIKVIALALFMGSIFYMMLK